MSNVFDLTRRLPRSETEPRRYDPHFVDLRFLKRASMSIFWGWTSRHGEVPEPLPDELERRLTNLITRHVSGVGQIVIDEDDDNWSMGFVTADEHGTYSYSLEVGKSWGRG